MLGKHLLSSQGEIIKELEDRISEAVEDDGKKKIIRLHYNQTYSYL